MWNAWWCQTVAKGFYLLQCSQLNLKPQWMTIFQRKLCFTIASSPRIKSKRIREIEGICVNDLQCNALDSYLMIQIQSLVISCIDVFTKICISMFSLCKETVRFMKCAIWAILFLPCSWQWITRSKLIGVYQVFAISILQLSCFHL